MLQIMGAVVLVIAFFIGFGWLMVYSLSWARNRGNVQSSVGHALQELERIVTKPAVEHVITAEAKLRKEDDKGGE